MLVSKNNIKIVLLLIFILVVYQISKTSPNNYFAYTLVAIGFYLVHSELNTEQFNFFKESMEDDLFNEFQPETELLDSYENQEDDLINLSNDDVDEDDGITLSTLPKIPEEKETISVNNDTDSLLETALKLEKERTDELQELKDQLIGTNSKKENTDNNGVSCDCNRAIAEAIAPLTVEVTKLRDAQKVSVNETEAKLKTYQLLVDYLMEKDVLTKEDSDGLKSKLASGILTVDEGISRLEKMKLLARNLKSKSKAQGDKNWWSEMSKSELPQAMYVPLGSQISSDFSNDYAILNTEKWTVPMARPPVCIDSAPKEIMPSGTSGFPINLKYFDDSRYVTTSASQEKLKKQMNN